MARVKVQAYDTEKAIVVEEGATKGATLGVNFYDEEGNILTLAQLIALANDAVEDSPLSATAWRLIQDIPPNVTALEEATGTGLFTVTGASTGAFRTLQQPGAGITITNPDGVVGNPTFALANDLAAVEALAGTGIAVRTAADTWAQRQVEVVAGSAAALSVANPAGVAGNIQFTVDQTLVALAAQNWALNALPIGTGPDTLNQVAFAANTFPARASAGNLVAKTITDDALLLLADADVPRIGTANAWTALQSVNANASPGSVPAPQAGTLVHIAQVDATACRAQFNAWGNVVQVQGVRANGTAGTPTALANTDNIAAFAAFGHDGTGYGTTPRANFVFQANGAWTGTSHGTRWVLQLTPSGSTTLAAVILATSNQFYPAVDNAVSLGIGANRWSEVFAAIGAINTSDAREKTPVRPFTDAELAAALALSDEVGFFRFLSSVDQKGRAAREHCGQTVQRAIEVMQKHGLDPFGYGFICHDRWDEQPETRDQETGEITQEYRAAGDRYSFRPDQLDRFIAKGIRENQKRIEARLAALEGKR